MLSKGQQWDWLGDPFWRMQTLLIVFLVAGGWLIYRELRFSNPVVNFRPLTERNFLMSCIIIFCTLRRAVCRHHFAARPAAIAVRLRRLSFRAGHVAGRRVRDHA